MPVKENRTAAKNDATTSLLTLAIFITSIVALQAAREILLPIALAILVSFLLTPLVNRLERWRVHRIVAVMAVVMVAFTALGGLGWVVTTQLRDLSEQLPRYRSNILAKVHTIVASSRLSGMADAFQEMQREFAAATPAEAQRDAASAEVSQDSTSKKSPANAKDSKTAAAHEKQPALSAKDQAVAVNVVAMPPSPIAQIQGWLGPLVAPVTTAGIVVVLVIFFLLKREDQRNRLLQLFGAAHLHATTEALTDIADRVSNYLRMQFLINAGYGTSVGVGLYLIGVPNALMWGVLSFSLRFLPYLGPWLSAVMPIAVSLAVSKGWMQPCAVAAWFALLELLVNNVAEPYLYGSTVGVSAVGVILAAIAWAWLWGPIGLVLAMPLTVCLVVAARYIPQLRFVTILLGDQPALALDERIYQRLLAFDEREAMRLAAESLEQYSTAEFFDGVLLKTLSLAERDRHAGLLTDDQEEFAAESVSDLVASAAHAGATAAEEIAGESAAPGGPAARERGPRVFCIALRDRADEIACDMLSQLLAKDSIEIDRASSESLTGEVVDAVESSGAVMAVISIVAPAPLRESRLLCRRLRDRCPDLPIVVGLWGADADQPTRLALPGDTQVATSLAEAVDRIQATASRFRLTAGSEAANGRPLVGATSVKELTY